MTVKNVSGSSRFAIPYGYSSWLDYWEEQAGSTKTVCGAGSCGNKDQVDAHVQKADRSDKKWYITPLCKACNLRTDEFDVFWDLATVPSDY